MIASYVALCDDSGFGVSLHCLFNDPTVTQDVLEVYTMDALTSIMPLPLGGVVLCHLLHHPPLVSGRVLLLVHAGAASSVQQTLLCCQTSWIDH